MTRIAVLAALTSLTAFTAAQPAAAKEAAPRRPVAVFPVDSVRAGMTGIGLTVFQGTKIDTFRVTILGVLKAYRPGANLILARAQGEYLEHTGIITGMSGSPIYIDGRLLGALAYTYAFSKEPVGGITPIGEMLSLLPEPGTQPPSEEAEGRLGAADASPAPPGEGMGGAQPIATPLVLSGFSTEAIRFLDPWLKERGFVASPGGSASSSEGDCVGIAPGSAVGVQLIRGDWSAAAIGTATWRDGDQVLAFGHPFASMGWVRFPFTAASIQTVLPSQNVSTKIGSPTMTCGTLVADRISGISVELGASPAMIPVSVSVRGSGKIAKGYRFEVVRSRYLTPSLIGSTVVNSIAEALSDVGIATVRYDLAYFMNGGGLTLRRGNAFLTTSPVAGVGEEVTQGLTLLLSDHFRPSTLDSVRVDVDAQVGLDAAKIMEIRVRPAIAAPGDSLQVEVLLRRAGRGTQTLRVGLRVPPQTPEGELTVRVCDGEETDKWDRERAPERYVPENFDQLVRIIEKERRLDRIYVQLYRTGPGATVRGGEISQAPPSVLGVLSSQWKAGAAGETKGSTLAEVSLPLGFVVRGCESMKLEVIPDRLR